jgi:predicted SnoaL-like aldol condensation-catalyzing enzyme
MEGHAMSAETMKSKLAEFRSRLYGSQDLGAVDTYIHPDFRSHNGVIECGIEGYKAFARSFHVGLPDLRPRVDHMLVEGDRIVSFTRWEGTHTGTFRGVAPTGRKLTFETADIFRVHDGLFIEHWDVVDRMAASTALGLGGVPGGGSQKTLPVPERNKKMLLDLYNAVVARNFGAVEGLLHEDFVEHNPGVPHDPGRSSGRQAFIDYFRNGGTPLDGATVDIKRMIADDDHALVHYRLVNPAHPRGLAVVDIFRVVDGRFSEHWDVLQEVPERTSNPHTMF